MTIDRKSKSWTPTDVVDVTGPSALLRNYLEQRDVRGYLQQAAARTVTRRAFDVGCGFGRLTPVLTEGADDVTGFEREATLVDTARRLLPKLRFEHVATLEQLPAADASAQFVLTFTVLQHMSDAHAEAVLAEIRRVLAPGGHLLLVEETDATLEAGDPARAESRLHARARGRMVRGTISTVDLARDVAACHRARLSPPGCRHVHALPAAMKPRARSRKVRFFPDAARFRAWLAREHRRSRGVWVRFHRVDSGRPSPSFFDVLTEALCFGWIDGLRKRAGTTSYLVHFAPRQKGSHWSRPNIARAKALIASGRMTAAGRKAFGLRDETKTRVFATEVRRFTLSRAATAAIRANARPGSSTGINRRSTSARRRCG